MGYITEEQIRHVTNQRPASFDLLKKYKYQYQQHLQRESEEEEYERRTEKNLRKREDTRAVPARTDSTITKKGGFRRRRG
jgi:hypothetical protein